MTPITLESNPLFFDPEIYGDDISFSENQASEPLTKTQVAWLPPGLIRSVASFACIGILTLTAGTLAVSESVIVPSVLENGSKWSKSPPVSDAIRLGAAAKHRLFKHVPHNDRDLEHPDID